MTLTERLIRESIIIDFNSKITYGIDLKYVDYPSRLANITFTLLNTTPLLQIADSLRAENEECNKEFIDGTYKFCIGINGHTKVNHFIACEITTDDDEELYFIDLSKEEQKLIYEILNEQCKEHLNQTCDDILGEAWGLCVR